jgi:nitroimidazol reductase NimA-like FMN-containing flavoprotein (pyridoxamine 5'-phosphate oxidase superfamily)
MRRAERAVTDREEIDMIIRGSQVCRLALALDDEPYLVPVSFGYDGEAIYLHTARAGKKIAFFEGNGRVCFEFEREVRLRTDPQRACRWSFHYQSVIGYGRISELLEPAAVEAGMNEIMRQYSGQRWNFEPADLERTRIWRIDIDSLTGKRV